MIVEELPEALGGERLDRIVALLAGVSRSEAVALIAAEGVRVDGVLAAVGKTKLEAGQTVSIDPDRLPRVELPQADASVVIEIRHADEDVIVVNKPVGLVVHPGAGNPDGTLVNALLAQFPEIASVGDPMRPGIVHRLDAGTSGLLVVARSERAHEALSEALAMREVHRRYLALIWGWPPQPTGVIDAPLGRDPRDPLRRAVVVDGKPARTRFEVVSRFERPTELALVSFELDTGRTHQIRVHAAAIGHPVVGDATYGGDRPRLRAPRPLLHATELAFEHPGTGLEMRFEAPIPRDMAAVLADCS
jgi:23S rRNA pseudouridine1911/1915/1917 synthase